MKLISDNIRPYMLQVPIPNIEKKYARYLNAGIPKWSYEQDMSNLRISEHINQKVHTYIKTDLEDNINKGYGLIIYSDAANSGKSTLLFKIAQKIIDLGMMGMCFYYPDLLSLFKTCLRDSNFKMEFKQAVQSVDFIAIDDFANGYVAKDNNYAINELSDMIYYCQSGYVHKTALLIASSIPLQAFKSYVSDSAFSKIQNNSLPVTLTSRNVDIYVRNQ